MDSSGERLDLGSAAKDLNVAVTIAESGDVDAALRATHYLFTQPYDPQVRLAYEGIRLASSGIPTIAIDVAAGAEEHGEFYSRWVQFSTWLVAGKSSELDAAAFSSYATAASAEEAAMCFFLIGVAAQKTGNHSSALDYYRQAVASDSAQPEYWDFIRDCIREMLHAGAFTKDEGNRLCRDALEAAERAIQLEPDNPNYRKGAAMCRAAISRNAPEKTGCFIATAASGSQTSWEVITLTEFRDSCLMRASAGRALVGLYYALSPPLAKFIDVHSLVRRPCLRLLVRPAAALSRLFVR